MRRTRDMLRAVFAVILLLCFFAACKGKQSSQTVSNQTKGVDISKRVELVIMPLGLTLPPRDMDKVLEEVNKITLEKLNCTVSIQPMTDWMSRYNLTLSSGENIDLIWTATWAAYTPAAYDGAWRDITDMVDAIAPELRGLVGEENWNISRINGRDYAIPTSNRNWAQWGVAWREDLRKKMGVPPVTNLETMEQYAEAIKKNYPHMIPFCDSPLVGLAHSVSEKNHYYNFVNSYGLAVKTDNPREFVLFHETPEFNDLLLTQRRWAEKGYIQPDTASSGDDGNAGMLSEKYAGNINGATVRITLNNLIIPARDSHPDWEIGYMNFGEMYKWTYRSHPTYMAYALPVAGKNPERTLLFIRELLSNKKLYQLLDMGIEGVHYKIDDGYYVSLNHPLNPGYPKAGVGALTDLFFNPDFAVYSRDYQWALDYIERALAPYEVTNYFEGFPEDTGAYQDKITAMSEIDTQYTYPVLRGAVPDPVAAMKDVNRRLNAAGRREVVQMFIEQYNTYLDGLGVAK